MPSDQQVRRSIRGYVHAALIVAALTSVPLVVRSQQPATPRAAQPAAPTTQPEFRTEANYVRVDVYATRDGVPVTDLQREDFELFDEKAPQQIDRFAHIATGRGGVQETRSEPATLRESAQAVATSDAGVFVLFLDAPHVDRHASQSIRTPLQRALDRLVGPGDLIAVMTPAMTARDISFSRRSPSAERIIESAWGTRDQVKFEDPTEQLYARCYPGIPPNPGVVAPDRGVAQEMILRRREVRTLDALEDLVLHLRDAREQRKAIITITNGWRLYGRNASLSRALDDGVPAGPAVAVDPRNGRLTTADQPQNTQRTPSCERDRLELAGLDHPQRFRHILDLANRANASFYPVDPRGMAVFDDDIMPVAGVGVGGSANPTLNPREDQQRLTDRHASLRTMAEWTDGLAVIDMNDLDRGLRRIIADLSSYYLLGYYSNRAMDGKFHAISVRSTRPGIQVRARPGYLAVSGPASRAVAPAATGPASTAGPEIASAAASAAVAVTEAVGLLAASGREMPVRLGALTGWGPRGAAAVWVTVEVGRATVAEGWSGGGDVDAMLLDSSGTMIGTARGHLDAGATSLRMVITSPQLTPGNYEVRVRAKGSAAAAASNESLRVSLPADPLSAGVMFFRAGPGAVARDIPTADARFRRNERLRVAIPAPATGVFTARLLDRAGAAMPLPLTIARLDDPDGVAWQSAQLTLAPLGPGDYVIELTVTAGADSRTTLAPFRIVQ
jgi:VWFA-related protein